MFRPVNGAPATSNGFECQKERKNATFGGSFQEDPMRCSYEIISPSPSTAAVTKQGSDVMCASGETGCMSNRYAAMSFGKSSTHMASGVADLNFHGVQLMTDPQFVKSPAIVDTVLEETENVNP